MGKVRDYEGLWFAVPLKSGRVATGLVARSNPKGVLLGYFFGPALDKVPEIADVSDLAPDAAVLVSKFGYLGLKSGRWPVIGNADNWGRDRWSMPAFVRKEEITDRTLLVFYDDDDPNKWLRDEVVDPTGVPPRTPRDGLLGDRAVEIVLSNRLDDNVGESNS